MYKNNSVSNELFIVANVNDEGNVISFPMGGGSSTKPSIKAHDNYESAKRSSRFFPKSKVVKVTGFEVVG
jgi:hypothetical protein